MRDLILQLSKSSIYSTKPPDTGNYLVFNDLTDFVDLTTSKSQTKTYQAVLVSNGEAKTGEFESDIIFTVNYK
ncbi:hypothetical protein ABLV74_26140, partial [Klebsiella sp. JB_Kp027]